MPNPSPRAATEFLRRLGTLPIRDWLAVRDGMLGRDHATVFAAYKVASALAAELGLAAEARALADDERRLTDAVAWIAEFRPDGDAITRRDVGAMQLLAEWAAVGLLVRDALPAPTFAALYEPFAAAIPFETLGASVDGPERS